MFYHLNQILVAPGEKVTLQQHYQPTWLAISAAIALISFVSLPWTATAGLNPKLPKVLRKLQAPYSSLAIVGPDGDLVYAHRADTPRTPASVLKLITVGASLSALGASFRFPTELYRDGTRLWIKGYGDPFLISEEWQALTQALPKDLDFDTLLLDDTFFADDLGIVQEANVANPYNARNAAFATNFNTIAFTVDARGRIKPEPQTPWVDFVSVKLTYTRRKKPRVSVQSDSRGVRISVTRRPHSRHHLRVHLGFQREALALYAGHLFVAFGKRVGRSWAPKTIALGTVGPELGPAWYVHQNSRTLADVCKDLLKYSNNFIANQLLLSAGARHAGPPATLEKAVTLLREHAKQAGMQAFVAYEASGLDPRDRVTAAEMGRYLWWISRKQPGFIKLLSPLAKGRVKAKSGTFEVYGVRALAGYILDKKGSPIATFALLCDSQRHCDEHTARAYERAAAAMARFLTTDK